MELVVDVNILLASFLKAAKTRELLLDVRLDLYAPECLISETSRHLEKRAPLRNRIHLSDEALDKLVGFLTRRIQVIPLRSYEPYFREALILAPHEEDAPFIAAALLLNIPIWSNDKGFKEQKAVKVYSTHDLLFLLEKTSE